MSDKELIEIRWHGRGGQGAVTSAELLARAAISEGKYAQAFPSFGAERRGAPVVAFNRISGDHPIRNRAGITQPDVSVVLDSTLLRVVKVTDGLKEGGTLIINTKRPMAELKAEFRGRWRLAVVDATTIARETLKVPIVNTTMLGALILAAGVVKPESLFGPLQDRFGRLGERNIEAMKRAYAETKIEGLNG